MIAELDFSMQHFGRIVAVKNELVKLAGKPKRSPVEKVDVSGLDSDLRGAYTERLKAAIRIPGKERRQEELDIITSEAATNFSERYADKAAFIGKILHDIERDLLPGGEARAVGGTPARPKPGREGAGGEGGGAGAAHPPPSPLPAVLGG